MSTLADRLSDVLIDAVLSICDNGRAPVNLDMIEILQIRHKLDSNVKLIRGLVLDHGSRHPAMPKHVEQCYILNCNFSLEHEKTEINAGFSFSNESQKEKMVLAERELTNAKVNAILKLKRKVCNTPEKSFL